MPRKILHDYQNLNPVMSPELMVKIPIKRTRVMTTDQGLIGEKTSLPPAPAPASIEQFENTRAWTSTNAAASGGPPSKPQVIYINDEFTPAVGVYIVAAPTGSGKTILSMSLVAWCNAVGQPATYVSCFEPRSPTWKAASRIVFNDANKFDQDVKAIIPATDQPKLVVFDSATLPIKANASTLIWRHQSTFKGGMQPSDRGFLDRLAVVAYERQACIVITLNSTLIPYVDDLAGGAEGIINIIDIGTFSYSDRTSVSARRQRRVTIPTPFVAEALNYFGFGDYRRSKTRLSTRGFVGVN